MGDEIMIMFGQNSNTVLKKATEEIIIVENNIVETSAEEKQLVNQDITDSDSNTTSWTIEKSVEDDKKEVLVEAINIVDSAQKSPSLSTKKRKHFNTKKMNHSCYSFQVNKMFYTL